MNSWKHKDVWNQEGKNFCVQISRHEVTVDDDDGPHRWCIYAYIYPNHPHFTEFSGPHLWQDATNVLPMHGGCSYLVYHRRDDGDVCSVQIGCDYAHIYDDRFKHYATAQDAQEVFQDAGELFDWLEGRAER